MPVPVLMKVSSQGQVSIPRTLRTALNHPSHFAGVIEKGSLILRPAMAASPAEAELLFGKHAITRDVLVEALRIVRDREGRGGGP